MADGYHAVISAGPDERRDLFLTTAQRIGTTAQNVEKDFWVCWVLDLLFNQLVEGPRLLFKGGTSLSKGYDLIERFSEDIDITVFRHDIGEAAEVAELEALSGKKRQARLDAIRRACQSYVNAELLSGMHDLITRQVAAAGIPETSLRIESDPDDADRQTLLVWYPATAEGPGYIRNAVKIEGGAKSALDPHSPLTLAPYVSSDAEDLDFEVPNVTTVDPSRTFWDKVIIAHGTRRWFDHRGTLRGEGQRISRHYYDLYQLINSDIGKAASTDLALAANCVKHAEVFFYRRDFDLAEARPGSFTLAPTAEMMAPLRADYAAMSGMIFGDQPPFETVIAEIERLEEALNKTRD